MLSPVDGAVRAGSLSAKDYIQGTLSRQGVGSLSAKDYLEGTLSRQGAGLTPEVSTKSGVNTQNRKSEGKFLSCYIQMCTK